MPSQPSSSSTETVRLADVFVRLPNDHHHHEHSAKRIPPQAQKTGSSENPPPASAQHRYPSAPKEPLTPQKKTSNVSEAATQGPHLPPTPAATPTKKNLKRGPTTAMLDPHTPSSSSSSSSIKRPRTAHHLTTPTPSPSPHRRFLRAPKFSIVYQPEPPPRREEGVLEGGISWLELKRAAESIMRQVCWEEVAEDVASNRSPGTYKRAVRGVLQGRIDELVSGEEKEEEKEEEGGK